MKRNDGEGGDEAQNLDVGQHCRRSLAPLSRASEVCLMALD